jgi:hypothetical protein
MNKAERAELDVLQEGSWWASIRFRFPAIRDRTTLERKQEEYATERDELHSIPPLPIPSNGTNTMCPRFFF